MEVTYYQSLLRKKSSIYRDPEYLLQFHTKAMTTIAVLNRNMIMCDVSFDKLFQFYKEPSKENCIKLLIRCRKMYDARLSVKKILSMVVQRELFLKL